MPAARLRIGVERRLWTGLAVFGGYALVAFLYLGLRLLLDPGHEYEGFGADPAAFIWCFGWWPYAILHGQNPFLTHAIWAPSGVNLTWTTSVPGLALLFAPLTLLAGPVASYNTATVLLPAFAAWTAFVLCRRLTDRLWPSLVGGYLFGFSSYELGEEEGHPHMTAVFLLPLVALVCIRYLEGELGGRGVVLRLAPLLGLELLISTEVTFTLALALATALALALALLPARRARLATLLAPLAWGYAWAVVLTAPFVYYAISGFRSNPVILPSAFVTDLANFAVPTDNALVSLGWAVAIADRFPGNDSERGAYLGLPVLLILGLFFWRRGRAAGGRFLLVALAVAVVATLGFRLTIDGHQTIWLPWSIVGHWPLFDNVLPERLSVYVALITAVVVALWTASQRRGWARYALPALAMLAIVPNPSARVWATRYTVPAFFTDSDFRSCLDPDETILPLPISFGSESMLWQVEADFRFRMAGGNIAPNPPSSYTTTAAAAYMAQGGSLTAAQLPLLEEFIRTEGITSVVVDRSMINEWAGALDRLATPQLLGGVVVYHVADGSPSCLGAASP